MRDRDEGQGRGPGTRARNVYLQLGGLELEALHEGVVDLVGRRLYVLLVGCHDLFLGRQQAVCDAV